MIIPYVFKEVGIFSTSKIAENSNPDVEPRRNPAKVGAPDRNRKSSIRGGNAVKEDKEDGRSQAPENGELIDVYVCSGELIDVYVHIVIVSGRITLSGHRYPSTHL
jgi:hypothetical protein